ncbi:MAG: DUF2142 domain-containing protein [Candidatus Nanopelagicales bacterium]
MVSSSTGGARVRGSHRLVPIAIAFVTFVLGGAWILASAPGSTADEDYHLGSIWCADGLDGVRCVDKGPNPFNPSTKAVTVAGLDGLFPCYSNDPATSAACQAEAAQSQQLFRVNDGLYPSEFYEFMNLFVGPDATSSFLVMRAAGFTVSLGLLLASLFLLPRPDRERVGLYWLLASVPLGLFLFTSVNPSGIAVAGTSALFVATIAVFRNSTPLLPGIVAALAAISATGSRSDAVYFCGFAVAAGLLCALPVGVRPRASQLLALLPAVAVLVVRFVIQDQTSLEAVPGAAGAHWLQNLIRVPGIYAQEGTTLGWLEFGMPEIVWVGRTVAVGMVVAIGVATARRRRISSLVVVTVAMLLVPVLILAQVNYPYGQWLQGRYVLPLLFVLMALMGISFRSDPAALSRPQAFTLAIVVSVANAVALHVTIRRYVTGSDVSGLDLTSGAEWWWPNLPVGPTAVWILGSLACLALSLLLAHRAATGIERRPPTDEAVALEPREIQVSANSQQ